MQASLNKQHIVGAVRGGGPTVRISTSSGDITVKLTRLAENLGL